MRVDADFKRNLDWVIGIFQTQDQLVIDAFKQGARKLIESEFFSQVLMTAMLHLADTDPDTFAWTLHHFDQKFGTELKRSIALSLTQTLIGQGFILGKDFSSLPFGQLLVSPAVAATLSDTPVTYSPALLQEIIWVA